MSIWCSVCHVSAWMCPSLQPPVMKGPVHRAAPELCSGSTCSGMAPGGGMKGAQLHVRRPCSLQAAGADRRAHLREVPAQTLHLLKAQGQQLCVFSRALSPQAPALPLWVQQADEVWL